MEDLNYLSIEEIGSPFVKMIEDVEIQEDEISDERGSMTDWRFRSNLRQAVIYSEILDRPYV